MALATATADGAPSVRMVLLKGADERGFVFFTGYASRKAAELDSNPRGALLFHWAELGRQVRVEGSVERVAGQESDAYFATRPRGAQLAATASEQSSVSVERERSSTSGWRHWPVNMRETTCDGPSTGAGTGSSRRRTSSGSTATTACTTACATAASNGDWIVERLSP